MNQKIINLFASLLVPAFGSVLFNALNQLIKYGPTAPVPPEIFDFAVGCGFTVAGLAATQKTVAKTASYFLVFMVLLFVLMGLDVILISYLSNYKTAIIWASNILSLAVVAVSIWNA
jgi:hypothetical protein